MVSPILRSWANFEQTGPHLFNIVGAEMVLFGNSLQGFRHRLNKSILSVNLVMDVEHVPLSSQVRRERRQIR